MLNNASFILKPISCLFLSLQRFRLICIFGRFVIPICPNLWLLLFVCGEPPVFGFSSSRFSQAERVQSYESNRKLCGIPFYYSAFRKWLPPSNCLLSKKMWAAKKINIKEKSILLSWSKSHSNPLNGHVSSELYHHDELHMKYVD